jgi:hypothetical protein
MFPDCNRWRSTRIDTQQSVADPYAAR